MAAEAALKIREAEDKGIEMIRNAETQAREILDQAEKDSVLKRTTVLTEAKRLAAEQLELARTKAEEDSGRLSAERGSALGDRIEKAVALVVERIVSS